MPVRGPVTATKPSTCSSRRDKGIAGENLAAEYLAEKGYRILARNVRIGRGEIDILAEDGETLVFVEVKARHSGLYGEPEEAITARKEKQLRTIADIYIARNDIDRPCRFDLIAIRFYGKNHSINHIEHVLDFACG